MPRSHQQYAAFTEAQPAAKRLKLQSGMAQQSALFAGHIPAGPSDRPLQEPEQRGASAKAPTWQQETPAAGQQSGKKCKQQVASPEYLVSGLPL